MCARQREHEVGACTRSGPGAQLSVAVSWESGGWQEKGLSGQPGGQTLKGFVHPSAEFQFDLLKAFKQICLKKNGS